MPYFEIRTFKQPILNDRDGKIEYLAYTMVVWANDEENAVRKFVERWGHSLQVNEKRKFTCYISSTGKVDLEIKQLPPAPTSTFWWFIKQMFFWAILIAMSQLTFFILDRYCK